MQVVPKSFSHGVMVRDYVLRDSHYSLTFISMEGFSINWTFLAENIIAVEINATSGGNRQLHQYGAEGAWLCSANHADRKHWKNGNGSK